MEQLEGTSRADCLAILEQVEKTISAQLAAEDGWVGIQWRSQGGQKIDRLFCDVTDPVVGQGWRILLQHYFPSPVPEKDEFDVHVAPVGVRVLQGGHRIKMRKKSPDGVYSAVEEAWPKDGACYTIDGPSWEYSIFVPQGVEAYTLVVRGKKFADSQESGTYEMFEPLDQEQRFVIFDFARKFYGGASAR